LDTLDDSALFISRRAENIIAASPALQFSMTLARLRSLLRRCDRLRLAVAITAPDALVILSNECEERM
jgi:hypothetical protein